MPRMKTGHLIILLLLFISAYNSFFVVKENQRGLLLFFGKLVDDPHTQQPILLLPGLHFKWPYIMQSRIVDMRIQTVDIKSQGMTTVDTRNIVVNYYVTWRVVDPLRYLMRTGDKAANAQILLEQTVEGTLRAYVGQHSLVQLLQEGLAENLKGQIVQQAKTMGLLVLSVNLQGVDFPSDLTKAIYQRMQTDCERIASSWLAQGKAKAEMIRSDADTKVTITLASAKADAAKLRGDGDAQAAAIYADAYGKDASFFAFYRSLAAYKHIFTSKDYIVLKPDSQFFKYFTNGFDSVGDNHSKKI